MANFLLDSVSGVLRSPAVSAIASQLGLSEQQFSQGLQTSVATLGAGLASKVNDSGFVRQLFDLAVRRGADSAGGASTLGSTLTPVLPGSAEETSNNQFLSSLFGGNTSGITSAIASATGLPASSISSMLGMAVPIVLGAVGTQIKTLGLDASGFGSWLSKERDSLLQSAPAGVRGLMGMSIPSIGQPTAKAISTTSTGNPLRLLWPALAAVVIIGALWTYMHRTHEVPVAAAPAVDSAGTTSTMETGAVVTGSTTLSPSSTDQLHDVAAILQAYPKAKVTIGGYTDNTGNANANLKLSQSRASSIMGALTTQGVAADRMTAKGYGDSHPVGDNSTEAGRAQNRRISLRVVSR